MWPCNRTPCVRYYPEPQDDDDYEIHVEIKRTSNKVCYEEDDPSPPPPLSFSELVTQGLLKMYYEARKLYRYVNDDPFRSQLFRSAVFFVIGSKLFSNFANRCTRCIRPTRRCCRRKIK